MVKASVYVANVFAMRTRATLVEHVRIVR